MSALLLMGLTGAMARAEVYTTTVGSEAYSLIAVDSLANVHVVDVSYSGRVEVDVQQRGRPASWSHPWDSRRCRVDYAPRLTTEVSRETPSDWKSNAAKLVDGREVYLPDAAGKRVEAYTEFWASLGLDELERGLDEWAGLPEGWSEGHIIEDHPVVTAVRGAKHFFVDFGLRGLKIKHPNCGDLQDSIRATEAAHVAAVDAGLAAAPVDLVLLALHLTKRGRLRFTHEATGVTSKAVVVVPWERWEAELNGPFFQEVGRIVTQVLMRPPGPDDYDRARESLEVASETVATLTAWPATHRAEVIESALDGEWAAAIAHLSQDSSGEAEVCLERESTGAVSLGTHQVDAAQLVSVTGPGCFTPAGDDDLRRDAVAHLTAIGRELPDGHPTRARLTEAVASIEQAMGAALRADDAAFRGRVVQALDLFLRAAENESGLCAWWETPCFEGEVLRLPERPQL